jgi:hypothetical protein
LLDIKYWIKELALVLGFIDGIVIAGNIAEIEKIRFDVKIN